MYIDKPLTIISQLQRCGGTLLVQLFDGHSECFVHPGEITIGHKRKQNFPKVSKDRYKKIFHSLFEKEIDLYIKNG